MSVIGSTYERLRTEAKKRGKSIAALLEEIITEAEEKHAVSETEGTETRDH